MKKLMLHIIVAFVVIALLTADSYAQTSFLASNGALQKYSSDIYSLNSTPSSRGNFKNIEFTSKDGQDEVRMILDGYSAYNIMRLQSPDRLVIDFANTNASAKQQKVAASGSWVKGIRYAQYGNSIARIVLDVSGQPQYQVVEKGNQLVLYVVSPSFKCIAYSGSKEKAYLAISDVKLTEGGGTPRKLYTEKYENDGKKYTITFPAAVAVLENEVIKINDDLLESVQMVNNRKTRETSIVFNAKAKLFYEAATAFEFNSSTISIKKSASDTTGGNEQAEGVRRSLGIKYTTSSSQDSIEISSSNYKGYNVMRLTGPDRIVVDIPNTDAQVKQESIKVGGGLVKTVRYGQFDKTTARVVLDVTGQPGYRVAENKDKLVVYVTRPTYKNIIYHNNGDRVYFTLPGISLTDGGENLKNLYTGKYDASGSKYTITFPSSLGDLGSGTMKINDQKLSSVEIVNNKTAKQVSIIFTAKDRLFYETIARSDDTAITVFKPAAKADRLVVIDPGHGGEETGAIVNGIYEKNLNLDIAVRLNALLKARNVKTYILREDDCFVGLYERAYIANDLNAALFVSIHNNAIDDTSFGGTMTLYYPGNTSGKGLSGKTFAQIVQNKLLNTLKTTDRKIIERPNLVVLKATTMPAVLAEVAFMTNKQDRDKLLKEEFRQKAASAICDGVVQALSQLE